MSESRQAELRQDEELARAHASLSYLVFEVSDLAAWDALLTRTIGLARGEDAPDGALTYRLDEQRARIFLKEGDADDLIAIGLELRDEESLSTLLARLELANVPSRDLAQEERFVKLRTEIIEPGGLPIELVVGPETMSAPELPLVPGGFKTGELGLGHIALRARSLKASQQFFERLLGFGLSDRIECELRGGYQVDIAFLHVNRRHHTVALGERLPKRIDHFMLETQTLEDLGSLYDRVFDHGVHVVKTLGQHPNDRMLSFYALTPSGIQFEIGHGGVVLEEGRAEPSVYREVSVFGHRSPRTYRDVHRSKAPQKHIQRREFHD